jgi:superfamily II DNA/RNA helicase
VVSIVGGMSTEKQERLLKKRPEIIVGTPGRLWELASGGEKHLVEVVIDTFCRLHVQEFISVFHMIIGFTFLLFNCNYVYLLDSE